MLEDSHTRWDRREFFKKFALAAAGISLPEAILRPPPPIIRSLEGPNFTDGDIALTVDDCFQADPLRKILDVIEQNQIQVTIFPVAKVFFNEPIRKQLLRAAGLGCCFGNHTFSHPNFRNLNEEQIVDEITNADEVLGQYLPLELILPIFRPPSGYMTFDIDKAVGKAGKKAIILWNCTTGSTGAGATKENCLQLVKDQLAKNSRRLILLAHANLVDGDNFAPLVRYLSNNGHQLVGLDRLFVQERKWLTEKQNRDEKVLDPR